MASKDGGPAKSGPVIEAEAQAILFDLDGTLIDSTGATERAWHKWADTLGITGYVHRGHGLPARDTVARHVAANQQAEALRLAEQLEEQETEGIEAKDGARELLAELPAERWAIVTSCTAKLARIRLQAAGLNAPTVLVTADDVVDGKPSPEGYQAAARALGFDADACLVVEDTPVGLAAGRSLGCHTLGVVGTVEASELDADYVVESLAQVSLRIAHHDGAMTLEICSSERGTSRWSRAVEGMAGVHPRHRAVVVRQRRRGAVPDDPGADLRP